MNTCPRCGYEVKITAREIEIYDSLTTKQREIIHLLLEGKCNKEIASSLHWGKYSTNTRMKEIYDKVGVDTRLGLAIFVFNRPGLYELLKNVEITPARKTGPRREIRA